MSDFTCVALKGIAYTACDLPAFKWLGRVPLCQRHYSDALKAAGDLVRREEAAWEKVVYGSRDWDASAAEVVYYLCRESDGLIKIGTSARYRSRLSELRAEHGPMHTLLTHRGDRATEQSMHRRFRQLRAEGEFFRPGRPLVAWIIKTRQRQPQDTLLKGTVSMAYLEALMPEMSGSKIAQAGTLAGKCEGPVP